MPPMFTQHTLATGLDGVHSIATADIDGDGDMDVASASPNDSTIAWHENDLIEGLAPTFTTHVTSTLLNGATAVDLADMDGDGDVDSLGGASFIGHLAWFEQMTPAPVCVGDIDGDEVVGFLDLNILLSNFGVDCAEE